MGRGVGVGEAVWSIVISCIILIMSITPVWKSRAKPARPPIMLDMRIRRDYRLSRCCHTAACAQAQPGCRAFEQDLAPKAHKPRGPAAGLGADPARLFDQPLVLDKPPEILLVQQHARQRLDRALQLQQRE